ncbi:hypothetical protein L7F22_032686 [Adiantum nelumboides]|nr:hypothetical protein [Adiantum nelumboides]
MGSSWKALLALIMLLICFASEARQQPTDVEPQETDAGYGHGATDQGMVVIGRRSPRRLMLAMAMGATEGMVVIGSLNKPITSPRRLMLAMAMGVTAVTVVIGPPNKPRPSLREPMRAMAAMAVTVVMGVTAVTTRPSLRQSMLAMAAMGVTVVTGNPKRPRPIPRQLMPAMAMVVTVVMGVIGPPNNLRQRRGAMAATAMVAMVTITLERAHTLSRHCTCKPPTSFKGISRELKCRIGTHNLRL